MSFIEASAASAVAPLQLPLWIDLAAVVVGALAGAGVAVRERFDLVGGLTLAVVMGLGGGILRDILLGLRPVAVTNPAYLPTVAAVALSGYLFTHTLQVTVARLTPVLVLLETFSIGLFTIVGVEKALLYRLPYPASIFIGVCAAVGGGLLVDVISGRPVQIVRSGPWNASAALAGGCVYAVTAFLGAPTGVSEVATFLVVVGMRLASLRWGLQTPVPQDLSWATVERRWSRSRRRPDPPEDPMG